MGDYNRDCRFAVFCRCCYYDLRGQQRPRCPECGTAFAFDDPRSFLGERPGNFARMFSRLRRRGRVLLVTLSVLLLISYGVAGFTLPSLRYPVHPAVLAAANLKAIITTWMIQQYQRPQQTVFHVDAARQDMSPSLSPWSEGRAARWKALITQLLTIAPYFIVPTMAYILVVAIFVGRRGRQGVFVLLAGLSLVVYCSVYPRDVAAWLCPGSHAFLDDYVYLPGIDFTPANAKRGRTIVAYDIHTFRRPGRRIIGFADGHVTSLWDDRAKPLFQAQGIPYPDVAN